MSAQAVAKMKNTEESCVGIEGIIIKAMKDTDLFWDLPPESLHDAARSSQILTQGRPADILLPGESQRYIYIVVEGYVLEGSMPSSEMRRGGDSRKKPMFTAVYASGDFFGIPDSFEMPANSPFAYHARNIQGASYSIAAVPYGKISAFEGDVKIAFLSNMMSCLQRANHTLTSRLSEWSLYSNAEKAYFCLRELATKLGRQQGTSYVLPGLKGINMTQSILAAIIGINRETVSTLLSINGSYIKPAACRDGIYLTNEHMILPQESIIIEGKSPVYFEKPRHVA